MYADLTDNAAGWPRPDTCDSELLAWHEHSSPFGECVVFLVRSGSAYFIQYDATSASSSHLVIAVNRDVARQYYEMFSTRVVDPDVAFASSGDDRGPATAAPGLTLSA